MRFRPRWFSRYYGSDSNVLVVLGWLWEHDCGRCVWDSERHEYERRIRAAGMVLFGRLVGIER